MASDRQIAANRRNAKKSTGPRSEAGRKASRRNARRHGLAVAIETDPAFHDEVEKLARVLSLSCGMQNVDERARDVVGAELDLLRIRKIRASLFETLSLVADDATSGSLAELKTISPSLSAMSAAHFPGATASCVKCEVCGSADRG